MGVVGKTVKAPFTEAAKIVMGVEVRAKARAERRKKSRCEVRGARKENETFAPAPALAMPEWYTRRRARVRWERLVGLAHIARHVMECHLTQETRVQSVMVDVASNICQALEVGARSPQSRAR